MSQCTCVAASITCELLMVGSRSEAAFQPASARTSLGVLTEGRRVGGIVTDHTVHQKADLDCERLLWY